MKVAFMVMIFISFSTLSSAESGVKNAFLEGIKASLKVVMYEKSQSDKPIPHGYCAAITSSTGRLDFSEEVKLESLALLFELHPAIFEKEEDMKMHRVLCLDIDDKKENMIEKLKKISDAYTKLKMYHIKIESLPSINMHRIIHGIGRYKQSSPHVAVVDKVDKIVTKKISMLTAKDSKITAKHADIPNRYKALIAKSELEEVLFIQKENADNFDTYKHVILTHSKVDKVIFVTPKKGEPL